MQSPIQFLLGRKPLVRTLYEDGKIKSATCMIRPSNFHAHLRGGSMLKAVAPYILRGHAYVLIMPNNGPDEGGIIRFITSALRYRDEILAAAQHARCDDAELIMTLYHTKNVTPRVIKKLARIRRDLHIAFGIKHYPPHPGATTGSGHGVPLEASHDMLAAMQDYGIPLLGHFESVYDDHNRELPPEEREPYFMGRYFRPLRDRYPSLKISIEHGSTIDAIECVKEDPSGNTVVTVAPWHLLFNNSVFGGPGANYFKCMPILKGRDHQEAIGEFVLTGDTRAIAGTDTAPWLSGDKIGEFADAKNGCFHVDTLGMYASFFHKRGKLAPASNDFLKFMCLNGPWFWGLPYPQVGKSITFTPWEGGVHPVPVAGTGDSVMSVGYAGEHTPPTYLPSFMLRPDF